MQEQRLARHLAKPCVPPPALFALFTVTAAAVGIKIQPSEGKSESSD